MEKMAAKLAATLYVFWGLLHFTAAYGVFKLAQSLPATMVQGRLLQMAFYLASFAAASIILAVTLNWRNDRLGFWSNAVMVGMVDIPFILFVLLPGYLPLWPGLLGPVLWISALLFSAAARVSATPTLAVSTNGIVHPT